MKLKGSQIVVETLKREGVKHMFGHPGGACLPLFDALYKCGINVILSRHEQGAAHEADGFARASGQVGVCIATSGPGATNLVTGLATAHMDSIPIVAITGQVKTFLIGNDAFQEADVCGVTRSITKHNYLVKDVKDLSQTLRNAFYIAKTGRPGPVLVDIPSDVTLAETDFVFPKGVNIRSYQPQMNADSAAIEEAVELIKKSKRPILYVGGGVIAAGAHKELTEFARITNIPVTMTLLGLGSFPGRDDLSLGMLGMHGGQYANLAVQKSDLLIAVGARFDDRVTGNLEKFAPHAKIIHIDIDPASISKNVKVDVALVGDAKRIMSQILKHFKRPLKMATWHKQINHWRKIHPLRYDTKGKTIASQYVLEELDRLTAKRNTIITTDVGQHQMWAAQWLHFDRPRTLITSGGLGTMGYGFPAAIGAQVARPNDLVFCVSGDGSIIMMMMELAPAVQHKIPVKVLILNNGYLGMVRQWQEFFYGKRYSSSELFNPDFVKIAEAYGATGIRITERDQVRAGLERAIETEGPVFIDCFVDRESNVWPMVPAGAALDQMMDMA